MVTYFAPLRSAELAARRERATLVHNFFTTRHVSSGRTQSLYARQQQTSPHLRLRHAPLFGDAFDVRTGHKQAAARRLPHTSPAGRRACAAGGVDEGGLHVRA